MNAPIVIEEGIGQLFIDDLLIETAEGLTKVVNQPVKYENNPVLVTDHVWEELQEDLLYATGCVMYDATEGIFKMWYQCSNSDWTASWLAYATSENGTEWEKPDTGFDQGFIPRRALQNGASGTNLILAAAGDSVFDWPIVWKDLHEADPSKRYKLAFGMPYGIAHIQGIGRWHRGQGPEFGLGLGFSPDGIHWDMYSGNPVLGSRMETPAWALLWDPKSEKYVCYLRRWADPIDLDKSSRTGLGNGMRVIIRSESEDFIHWTEPTVCLRYDDSDPELNRQIYNMEVMEYEGLYIGFMSMYHIAPVPDPESKSGVRYVSAGSLPENIPGFDSVDIQLAVSRDTRTWQRVGNETWERVGGPGTFIPVGQEGEFDSGMLYVLQAPVVVDDEVWIYYMGSPDKHDDPLRGTPQQGGIGLAKLKRDRFVSLETQDGKVGTLTTRPLALGDKGLAVNCDASNGELIVEVLDERGNVVEGFGREDCKGVRGDQISAPVEWREGQISSLGQAPIRLRFFLDNAKLYSFTPID